MRLQFWKKPKRTFKPIELEERYKRVAATQLVEGSVDNKSGRHTYSLTFVGGTEEELAYMNELQYAMVSYIQGQEPVLLESTRLKAVMCTP